MRVTLDARGTAGGSLLRGAALAALSFVVACAGSEPELTVREYIDRVLVSAPDLAHNRLPAPSRLAVLEGKTKAAAAEATVRPAAGEEQPGGSQDVRALIAMGQRIVPQLIALLQDPKRRVKAAYVLAEIGGSAAGHALWAELQPLLERVERRLVYVKMRDGKGGVRLMSRGLRYVGVDHEYYLELFHGVAYTGEWTAGSVAAALETWLVALELIPNTGKGKDDPTYVEYEDRVEDFGPSQEVTRVCETLQLAGMIGGGDVTPAITRALKSPLFIVQCEALGACRYLADPATFPELAKFLRDEREIDEYGTLVCEAAVEVLAYARDRRVIRMDKLTPGERRQTVEVWRERELH